MLFLFAWEKCLFLLHFWGLIFPGYRILYTTAYKNKDLLYSTKNYIQYLRITHDGKESEAVHLKLI